MNKQEVLEEVRRLSASQEISLQELTDAYSSTTVASAPATGLSQHIKSSEVFYYIGGLVVFLGISILLFQNWDFFNFPIKLLVTLGVALAMYVSGVLLASDEKYDALSTVFFMISALIMPVGLAILFDNLGLLVDTSSTQSIIAAVLLAMYVASYFAFQKQVFTVFNVIFGTWLFFAFTSFIVGPNAYSYDFHFFEYRFLITGIVYLFLGYYFAKLNNRLSGPLYGFGTLFFLGAALALGGWTPNENVLWEIIFPALVIGLVYFSIYLRSSSILVFGAIYLMVYIMKITSEYFAQGIGWPFALMIAGFLLMFIGYFTVKLKKKYITHPV